MVVEGNAVIILSDIITHFYDDGTGSVLIQRVQSRKDGSFTGVSTLRSFSTSD
ncbi:hypothetical protein LJR153_007123 [Paenibacillus sp. LjRoot153]|uniref:hypothetical protein n=1 Tax=Paenibacillus sp. LjRoot153 TaxID=3342270 RepID=UPI003ECDAF7F